MSSNNKRKMLDLEQKRRDLNFGLYNEDLILAVVNERYNNTYKVRDRFANFDFRNDTFKIDFELKSRRIYKGQYSTIFFNEDKLTEGRQKFADGTTNRIIYLFSFVKKANVNERVLWFWEDDGRDLEVTMEGNLARGDSKKPCVNVPMELLERW